MLLFWGVTGWCCIAWRRKAIFYLEIRAMPRDSVKSHYQLHQGLSKSSVQQSKHFSIRRSMLSCAVLSSVILVFNNFTKLLQWPKLYPFTDVGLLLNIVMFPNWTVYTFLWSRLLVRSYSSIEYFHPTNIGSFGHPITNCHPTFVEWMLDEMLDRVAFLRSKGRQFLGMWQKRWSGQLFSLINWAFTSIGSKNLKS